MFDTVDDYNPMQLYTWAYMFLYACFIIMCIQNNRDK